MAVNDDERRRLQQQFGLEQAMATLADNFPPMWRRMYMSLLQEGFSKDEALEITQTVAFAQVGGKLTP